MYSTRLPFTMLAVASLIGGCSSGDRDAAITAEEPAETPPTRYDAGEFFATTSYLLAGGHAWSPDDEELLVSSDETGIFNAYSVAAADGAKRLLTSSTTDSTFAVTWFPDDARMLFSADQGGNELDHLYTAVPDAEPQLITPHEGNVSHGVFDFTRDSKEILYSTDEHGEFRQASTYVAAGGSASAGSQLRLT